MIYNLPRVKKKTGPVVPEGAFLTFSSPEAFDVGLSNGVTWDGTIEYSTDAQTWSTWSGDSLSAVANENTYFLHFRGIGNTIVTGYLKPVLGEPSWSISGSNIACTGNIETLLDYAIVEAGEHPTMGKYCYYKMFYGCTGLTTAPALPATTLATFCYSCMFYDCTGLTEAPALPATTLASSCYDGMFGNCTGLIKAPALPATTLETNCYSNMFTGCTGLTTAPALPATSLSMSCYMYMFYGCTSIKFSETQTDEYTQEYRIPTSGEGTAADYAMDTMFYNTGGTFTGTPEINTTYYLHKDCSIV